MRLHLWLHSTSSRNPCYPVSYRIVSHTIASHCTAPRLTVPCCPFHRCNAHPRHPPSHRVGQHQPPCMGALSSAVPPRERCSWVEPIVCDCSSLQRWRSALDRCSASLLPNFSMRGIAHALRRMPGSIHPDCAQGLWGCNRSRMVFCVCGIGRYAASTPL